MGTSPIRVPLSPEKRRLVELRLNGSAPPGAVIPRRSGGSSGPLALAQEPFWISESFAPGSAAYAVVRAWRLGGLVDPGLLAVALHELASRHEVLRTIFTAVDGTPMQLVLDRPDVSFLELDLRAEPDPGRAALAWIAGSGAALDLRRRPPWQAALLRVTENEQLLVVCAHHIVCDAWSLDLVLSELDELYRARRDGRPSALPPLPVQYLDYALWHRGRVEGELAREVAHWRERLAGAPAVAALPLDRPRTADRTDEAGTVMLDLPRPLVASLRELAAGTATSLFAICLAALACVAGRRDDKSELVVGVPVAGRTTVELEQLIGCFVNMLPLRLDLAGHPTFRELVVRVRARVLDALAHQDVPFRQLVRGLGASRNARSAPIFQVLFSHHEGGGARSRFADLPAVPLALPPPQRIDFDLTPTQTEDLDGMTCQWGYATDVFDSDTVEQLAAAYRRVLEAVATDPDLPVDRLPLDPLRGLRANWTRSGEPGLLAQDSAVPEPLPRAAIAPRTELEREVAAIWAEVLGDDEVGVDDDFFELGGDSLLLMRVLARTEERFGIEFPLAALFPEPTVERLAAALGEELRKDERTRPARAATGDLDDFVAGLSDEDADAMLRQLLG